MGIMCIAGRIPQTHNVQKLCEFEHDFDQQECNFEGHTLSFKPQLDLSNPKIGFADLIQNDPANLGFRSTIKKMSLIIECVEVLDVAPADDSVSIVTTAPMIPRHLTPAQSLTCVHLGLATLSHSQERRYHIPHYKIIFVLSDKVISIHSCFHH